MTIPFTFANQSGTILLAELDANFTAVNAYANTAGTVVSISQPNITSVGVLNSLSVNGNVFGNNVYTGNVTAGNISITGNIHSDYFLGNGRFLTGINAGTSYGNSNVADYLPTYTGNLTAGNVVVSGNITAVNSSLSGNVYINQNVAMVSNILRKVWVSSVAPTSSDGAVGDIWYQTP
jgi:hypothetical protein